jgi:hypothetical protein
MDSCGGLLRHNEELRNQLAVDARTIASLRQRIAELEAERAMVGGASVRLRGPAFFLLARPNTAGLQARSAARSLLQADASAAQPCSKDDVRGMLAAADPQPFVLGLMATNPSCGLCIVACAGKPMPDLVTCVLACEDQRGYRCDNSTGLARIEPLINTTTLGDRESIANLLLLAEADCAYCILETIEYVFGEGAVRDHVHIFTDFRPDPLPCLPHLAAVLATNQAAAVAQGLRAGLPFGLTAAPHAAATDIFVPTAEIINGWRVFRGLNRGEWLHRCSDSVGVGAEMWSLSPTWDRTAGCEGRLWLAVATSRLQHGPEDRARDVGGVHFDFELRWCSEALVEALSRAESPVANAAADAAEQLVTWAEGTSSLRVGCDLLLQFGAHSAGRRMRPLRTRVQFPEGVDAVEVFTDLVVQQGETVVLVSSGPALTTMSIGRRHLRVDAGGSLSLVRLALVDSTGSSAVYSEGELHAVNSTFARCVTAANAVFKFAEQLVPLQPASSESPAAGAFVGRTPDAFGGKH